VTVVSCASSSSKRKRKEKRKENQYKIRKIKEKKNKIVSVQVSHNNTKLHFFKISTIYYTGHKSRLWQLQCNYVQNNQNYMEDKKRKKKENWNKKKYKKKISKQSIAIRST